MTSPRSLRLQREVRLRTAEASNKSSTFIQVLLSGFGMGEAEWYDIDTYTQNQHPQITAYLEYMAEAL